MKIALLGDIALFGINDVQDVNYKKRFKYIHDLLKDCDYVVGNLETPLTEEVQQIGGKSAYIKSRPQNIKILKYLGVTHVSLANNHMYDYGRKGLEDTIKNLNERGIEWFGVDDKECIIQDDSSTVCLQGYCCYSTNGKGLGEGNYHVNALNPKSITDKLKQNKSDMLYVLSMHWGEEHTHYPNFDHIKLSRKMCDEKKILIYGHHPHVIQGIEEHNGSIVAYSLGNFCFDDVYTPKSPKPLIHLSNDNKESFVLIIEVTKNEISNYTLNPFSFYNMEYSYSIEVGEKINEYSKLLSMDEKDYCFTREKEISEYLKSRKVNRDFTWYIKRLNIESIKIIISSHKNRRKYRKLVLDYINQEGNE